jgi:predicted DNA-binding transcriptional regulator AlpA
MTRPEPPGHLPGGFFHFRSILMTEQTEAIDYVRTRKQVAEFLGISLRTLQRMESRGEIPGRIRVSDRIYGYRQSTIDRFLASRTAA